MKVIMAKSAGFCFGVKNAVAKAYEMVRKRQDGDNLVMLGELVHNDKVTSELIDNGFCIIDRAEDVPSGSKVIIRAHGVTPQQKEILASKGVEIYDMTCPFVGKIHKIVKEEALSGNSIILTGTPGHPEVEGIRGEAQENVRVISSAGELADIDIHPGKTVLISQTTFRLPNFQRFVQLLKIKLQMTRFLIQYVIRLSRGRVKS